MASVTKETRNGRTLYRIQYVDGNKRRRKIRLGHVTRKDAEYICSKVSALVAAKLSQRPLDSDIARWVANLGDDLAGKLAEQGLIERRASATLGDFLSSYIEGRKVDVGKATIDNFRQLERNIVAFLGSERDLRSITEGDADDFRQAICERYADATVAKLVKKARQVFKAAQRRRLCETNPFAEVKAGSERNDSRKHFVSREITAQVIDACPDAEWRLIVALARYGGLRTPSELLRLRLDDIDWAGQTFTVTSPKTRKQGKPWRVVPLFPELQPYLLEIAENAPEGAEYVINRYRDSNSNLRTQLLRIIKRAGVEPWPRLFQNLRASCETELANRFPLHVVTAWLGNTPSVADKHYLQVTPEHFAQAVAVDTPVPEGKGGATGGAQRRPVGRQVGLQAAASRRSETQEEQAASGVRATNAQNPKALRKRPSCPARTRT